MLWKWSCYAAFVLPAGEPDAVRMIDLGDAAIIDELIAEFRDCVTGQSRAPGGPPPTASEEADRVGAQLRARVFDPLREALGGRTRVFLSPDSHLNRLPFEVLPTESRQRLIDEYEFSDLTVGRDILRWDKPPASEPSPSIIVADPDFDARVRRHLTVRVN